MKNFTPQHITGPRRSLETVQDKIKNSAPHYITEPHRTLETVQDKIKNSAPQHITGPFAELLNKTFSQLIDLQSYLNSGDIS